MTTQCIPLQSKGGEKTCGTGKESSMSRGPFVNVGKDEASTADNQQPSVKPIPYDTSKNPSVATTTTTT
eukprot:3747022-Amphidinium_carterae.1